MSLVIREMTKEDLEKMVSADRLDRSEHELTNADKSFYLWFLKKVEMFLYHATSFSFWHKYETREWNDANTLKTYHRHTTCMVCGKVKQ